MIHFYCTKCHKKLEAVEDWAGSSCNCPECGTELVIPNKSEEEEKKTSITVTEEKPIAKPIEESIEEETKSDNDQVINETKFLLDYLESSRKNACITVIAASVIFCVMGIIMFIAAEEGAIGGVVIAVVSGIAGYAGSKIVSTMYRLKRVHWILMLGIYKNTKKA